MRMKKITFIRQITGWRIVLILFFLIQFKVQAQSIPVFANTIASQDEVDFASNAIDNDLATRARIRASSGLAIGIGAYSGHLELQFPTTLPANTTSFVKIQTDDEILPSLLGGSLGNVLSGVTGVLLIGNQEITVQAKNGGTPVLIADSQMDNDFATPRMRIVVNAANEYFIALTPSQAYNRIRLSNRLGTLIGLNNTKRFDVYGAFYIGTPDICGGGSYTSYDGSGLTLDILGLGGAGVSHPNYVLDANTDNFSRLSFGIIGVAASVEQTVYFDGTSALTDQFFVRMRIDPALLALGIANNIQIVASNGPFHVQTISLNALLNTELLTLLQGNNIVSIPFSPGGTVNRITVRYNSLLNVQLSQSLDLYDITRAPANPTITDTFTQNAIICSGSTASLIAETGAGTELNWYASATGGAVLAATVSGEPFVTPALTTNTSYYVAAKRIGCSEESERIRINVVVTILPVGSDITIASPVNACNGAIILSPASSIGGATFRYYKDQNKTIEITTGFAGDAGVIYVKDNTTGQLSIAGLNAIESPYTYYVSLTVDGLCENAANTLKPVVVHFSTSLNLTTLTAISGCGFVNLKDAVVNFDSSPDIEYHFFDSANQPISAEAAENIQASGTYSIQAVSVSGSCSSTVEQVNVTVNLQPTLVIPDANLVVSLGASIMLNATSDSAITWYDAQGNTLPSNTFGPFTTAGFYTFTAIASNANCAVTGSVTVVVIDPANCPALTERVYAESQSWTSILTGGVFNAADAIDHNPQTHSTIVTGIGLLGVGTTWQTLQWEDTVAAGTPVTIKLGSEYSGLVAAGAYSVVGTKRSGAGIAQDIGFIQPVSGSLVDLLPGENTFEVTFVPSDSSGPKPYDGVRIIVGSVASIAQNVKVYEAYYDRQVTQVACGNDDVEDVFSGVVDFGLGVATATVAVVDPWNSVDNSTLSYASMYSGAGILAAADLTVSFRTPTLTSDRLDIILSRPATILDLGLLSGLTIQLYMGSTPVSPVYDVNASLLSLTLIDGGAAARLTLQSQTVIYDRIKIRFGGTVSVLDHLRIHDIRRRADTSVIGADQSNTIAVCAGQTISLTVPADDCTTYIWYDSETNGNVVSTGSNFTIPASQAAGTYTYYIQPVRFGCETFARGLVTIIVGQTAPPTAITGVSLNGSNATTFCDQTAITLTATLDATTTITNPVFHWYNGAGLEIAGQTANTLVLTGLAPGTYTYSVGISSGEYCETAAADRATVTFTILRFSESSDIAAADTLICQGTNAVVTPTSILANPQFTWCFNNLGSQPIASGSTVGGITFTIAADGQLTLSGLTLADSPYTYYVGLVSDTTCLNEDGNFKSVTITVNDSGTPTTNDDTQEFCQATNPTLANILVNEVNIAWYDASVDGNLLPADTALTNGVYYAGFAPSSGCGSAVRLAVTVTINDAPTPTANDVTQDFCAIENPTVANIQVNETNVTWYLVPTGGIPIAANEPLANGTTYYGSLTVGSCESSVRLAVAVNINDADTPTTSNAIQNFCLVDSPSLAAIQVNQAAVIWYDASNGGNIVQPTDALTNGMTYYASMTDADTGCASAVRLAVTVNVSNPDTPTTSTLAPTFCAVGSPTIADIQINESAVIWYDAVTSGNVLPTSTALVNGVIYHAALFDATTGCESATRLAIQVIVSDVPTPTTTGDSQDFCQSDNPTVANIQVNEPNIIWYNAANGGTQLATTDALIDGSICYASQVIDGCESGVRLAVTVNVNTVPTPTTTDTTQSFCQTANPTVANIQVNETGVTWYDAVTGGNIVPLSTALADGVIYYAAIANGDCESFQRLAITVSVSSPATPTTNNANQSFCAIDSPTIADIQINESPIIWYDAATGGNVLPTTTALINGGVYHAALFDDGTGCESTVRLLVSILVNDAPTPTTLDDTQEFCQLGNPTVASLQVNEPNIVWYNAPNGGTQLATTNLLIDDAVYYAAQVVNGCESSIRLAITVNITDGATPTTNDNTQDFCVVDAPTLANIQTNESNIIWFDAATGGNTLATTTSLTNGTTYFASFDGITGCTSTIRLAVTVSVNDASTPTTNDTTQEVCQSTSLTLADIQVNETGVIWYSSASGGTALAASTPLDATTYYCALIDANTGCESSIRLALDISFTGSPTATITAGNTQPCVFDTVTYTTESGMTNYIWTVTGGTIATGGQTTDNFVSVTWSTIVAGIVTVSYTNSCNATSTGTATANVTACSDLTITKTVSNTTPMVSENVTFTVTVTNVGQGQFHNVVVQDVLPTGYQLISMTATAGTYSNGNWIIDTMTPNQVAVMTMTVKVLGTGNYVNTALIIGSDPIDSDVGNNTAEATVDPICLTVYNEFSPNNDGANDSFMIDCIENFPNNKLDVYNRYGSLVYSKTKYLNDWDGTANVSGVISKDDKLPAGTYYYVLDIGAEGVKTGWLAITR
jgi:gliding motility-associated-like protein/uncharacterized repeat protein (TIGR01451 family)